MANPTTERVDTLLAKAKGLLDAVTFDENGAMVGGQWVGGNGGMISRETIIAAHALRLELSGWKPPRWPSGGRATDPERFRPLLANADELRVTDVGPRIAPGTTDG